VRTDAATLVALNLRQTTYDDAVRRGRLTLAGSRELVRGFRTWFLTSPFAPYVSTETA
jgi:hypothetical protein